MGHKPSCAYTLGANLLILRELAANERARDRGFWYAGLTPRQDKQCALMFDGDDVASSLERAVRSVSAQVSKDTTENHASLAMGLP